MNPDLRQLTTRRDLSAESKGISDAAVRQTIARLARERVACRNGKWK